MYNLINPIFDVILPKKAQIFLFKYWHNRPEWSTANPCQRQVHESICHTFTGHLQPEACPWAKRTVTLEAFHSSSRNPMNFSSRVSGGKVRGSGVIDPKKPPATSAAYHETSIPTERRVGVSGWWHLQCPIIHSLQSRNSYIGAWTETYFHRSQGNQKNHMFTLLTETGAVRDMPSGLYWIPSLSVGLYRYFMPVKYPKWLRLNLTVALYLWEKCKFYCPNNSIVRNSSPK